MCSRVGLSDGGGDGVVVRRDGVRDDRGTDDNDARDGCESDALRGFGDADNPRDGGLVEEMCAASAIGDNGLIGSVVSIALCSIAIVS
jgi:hypothetical protein